jgi:hypothetical protein
MTNLIVKLQEAEHREANYIENWVELAVGTLRDARSKCPTGTLEAAHENEKAGEE